MQSPSSNLSHQKMNWSNKGWDGERHLSSVYDARRGRSGKCPTTYVWNRKSFIFHEANIIMNRIPLRFQQTANNSRTHFRVLPLKPVVASASRIVRQMDKNCSDVDHYPVLLSGGERRIGCGRAAAKLSVLQRVRCTHTSCVPKVQRSK